MEKIKILQMQHIIQKLRHYNDILPKYLSTNKTLDPDILEPSSKNHWSRNIFK